MLYNKSDISRGIRKTRPNFSRDDVKTLPAEDESGVGSRQDPNSGMKYWREESVVRWAIARGYHFDPQDALK